MTDLALFNLTGVNLEDQFKSIFQHVEHAACAALPAHRDLAAPHAHRDRAEIGSGQRNLPLIPDSSDRAVPRDGQSRAVSRRGG